MNATGNGAKCPAPGARLAPQPFGWRASFARDRFGDRANLVEEELVASLDPRFDEARGLSGVEAKARLEALGPNELLRSNRRTPFRIAFEVLREPMLLMLVGAGAIYLALGDLTEALVLVAFAMVSIVITVVQEARTERVLEALRDLTSPRALVIRDGRQQRIAGREVVRGDLLILSEGDRVAADARLVECHDLQTDESLLTGESLPVRKVAAASRIDETPRPGGDDVPFVFSGSLVVRGHATARVTATGSRSEIGKISQSLRTLPFEPPRLQAQTRRLVRTFGVAAGAMSLLAVVLYGTFRGGWLDAALAGVALSMSLLPEEFPVVLTVFMAMGAWRISKANVLTRRASALETLGSTTVLCTDKTGTLTQNVMAVAELRLPSGAAWRPGQDRDRRIFEDYRAIVETALRCSAREPVDPMERAIHSLACELSPRAEPARAIETLRTYGLRPDLLAVTSVVRAAPTDGDLVVASKGAPEAIARLCRLDDVARAALTATTESMAKEGMRVIGVARASHPGPELPDSPLAFAFQFLGLIGLADPLRPSVVDAVAACRTAGIRVVMITGDHPTTAREIARKAGLSALDVVTGDALGALDDAALRLRVREATVFARVLPEQKLRIVTAFKQNGEVVAMTGDGVNDAPSLKAAHIGIAMGGRGTDVAREASSIVLLNDDFGSIVAAIRLGRRIYDNLEKVVTFIVAVHVPIAGLALVPLPFGLPLLLGPIHIALVEMVIDPVSTLVFESETDERNVMERPPRDPAKALFSASLVIWGLVQGLVNLLCVLALFGALLLAGVPEAELRAITFVALVLSTMGLVLVNRSFDSSLKAEIVRPNRALGGVAIAMAATLALSLQWPWAARLLGFASLGPEQLLLSFGTASVSLVALQGLKAVWRRRTAEQTR
jgi:Ca2+-transporting ATPase